MNIRQADWYMTNPQFAYLHIPDQWVSFPDLSANIGDIEGEPAGLHLEFLGILKI